MSNAAALYFKDQLGQTTESASAIASIFEFLNLFAQGLGGFVSDKANAKWAMRGRLWVQTIVLLCEGALILVFSKTESIVVMASFRLFLGPRFPLPTESLEDNDLAKPSWDLALTDTSEVEEDVVQPYDVEASLSTLRTHHHASTGVGDFAIELSSESQMQEHEATHVDEAVPVATTIHAHHQQRFHSKTTSRRQAGRCKDGTGHTQF